MDISNATTTESGRRRKKRRRNPLCPILGSAERRQQQHQKQKKKGLSCASSSSSSAAAAASAAMNPVNATSLYVSTCRYIMQCEPQEPGSFSDLYKLLPYLRQSLSCCVCGNLLKDPIAPTNSTCQHYVCKVCKGKKMMMKPSCSWCKDYERFEENKQLSILVCCYKKLCEYIAESPISEHLATAVDGAPDILTLLQEGLSLDDGRQGTSGSANTLHLSNSPPPSSSECINDLEMAAPQVIESTPPDSTLVSSNVEMICSSINGLPGCNGLAADELAVNTISSAENSDGLHISSTGEDFKDIAVSDSLQITSKTVSVGSLDIVGADVCSYNEDIKPIGCLLLSSEHVFQETVSSNLEACSTDSQPISEASASNGPHKDAKPTSLPPKSSIFVSSNAPPHGNPCVAATPKIVRVNRKRSRSESDSERIQPLPISSIIHGPPLGAATPVPAKRETKLSTETVVTVPNGGTPKVGKALLTASKSVKKHVEHGAKKAHSKVKQGTTKSKTKEKVHSSTVMPGSPSKIVYKKPQEKKGCKCGRATQNPSVLTCRGQRCPCYSNRKACLDCICRGCQNSYMANGEKKLEAFAVPEKALEQTRLTVGISLTSISNVVRSASTSASVINVTTGSPIPTFLAASPREDKSLEETIDYRYDC
ncbi:E3 ubiquitin-protein ligase MSL2 [Callorhinchus milii]|uniref:E3 ubiquitin-protein ligase MSL2 n=1 Tax=Callorhinchus milii TaxID=7868 RepID=UPI001C3F5ECC|nr:E3 ubiquitin-protein ligase MSL2 [Callorhinchus milii]